MITARQYWVGTTAGAVLLYMISAPLAWGPPAVWVVGWMLGLWFGAAVTVACVVKRRRRRLAGGGPGTLWPLVPIWLWSLTWTLVLGIPVALASGGEPTVVPVFLALMICSTVSSVLVLAITRRNGRAVAGCLATMALPLALVVQLVVFLNSRSDSPEIVAGALVAGVWFALIAWPLASWGWDLETAQRGTLCPGCGYDLVGLERATVCPECGRTVDFEEG
jgi:hypothetical protein